MGYNLYDMLKKIDKITSSLKRCNFSSKHKKIDSNFT